MISSQTIKIQPTISPTDPDKVIFNIPTPVLSASNNSHFLLKKCIIYVKFTGLKSLANKVRYSANLRSELLKKVQYSVIVGNKSEVQALDICEYDSEYASIFLDDKHSNISPNWSKMNTEHPVVELMIPVLFGFEDRPFRCRTKGQFISVDFENYLNFIYSSASEEFVVPDRECFMIAQIIQTPTLPSPLAMLKITKESVLLENNQYQVPSDINWIYIRGDCGLIEVNGLPGKLFESITPVHKWYIIPINGSDLKIKCLDTQNQLNIYKEKILEF